MSRISVCLVRMISMLLGTKLVLRKGRMRKDLYWTSSTLILLSTLCYFGFCPHYLTHVFLKITSKLQITKPTVVVSASTLLNLGLACGTIGPFFFPPVTLFIWLWGYLVSSEFPECLLLFLCILFWLSHKCWEAPRLGHLSTLPLPPPPAKDLK